MEYPEKALPSGDGTLLVVACGEPASRRPRHLPVRPAFRSRLAPTGCQPVSAVRPSGGD